MSILDIGHQPTLKTDSTIMVSCVMLMAQHAGYRVAAWHCTQAVLEETDFPFHLYGDALMFDTVVRSPRFTQHFLRPSSSQRAAPFMAKFEAVLDLYSAHSPDVIVLLDSDCLVRRALATKDILEALGSHDFALHEQAGITGSSMNRQAFFDHFVQHALPAIDPLGKPEEFPRFRFWNSGVVIARAKPFAELAEFALSRFHEAPERFRSADYMVADQDFFHYWLGRDDSPSVRALGVEWNDCEWWNPDYPSPEARITHFSNFGKGPTHHTLTQMALARQQPGVSSIVVSYQSGDTISRHVSSLLDSGLSDIHLWDNNSVDTTSDQAESLGATVWQSPKNLGFGEGMNQLAHRVGSEYLLASTPDVVVTREFVEKAQEVLDSQPDVAVVCSDLIDADGQVISALQPAYSRRRILWECLRPGWSITTAPRWMRRLLGFSTNSWQWAIGACLMMRREALLELGGYDPKYFVYMEDVDLGYRLSQAGLSVEHIPVALEHHTSTGSSISHLERVRLLVRARAQFARTHYGPIIGALARVLGWLVTRR